MPRTPAYREIITDIRASIESGQLRPGDQLPTIAQHAVLRGVSTTPVKIALRILDESGWIQSWQGKGSFVAARRPR